MFAFGLNVFPWASPRGQRPGVQQGEPDPVVVVRGQHQGAGHDPARMADDPHRRRVDLLDDLQVGQAEGTRLLRPADQGELDEGVSDERHGLSGARRILGENLPGIPDGAALYCRRDPGRKRAPARSSTKRRFCYTIFTMNPILYLFKVFYY